MAGPTEQPTLPAPGYCWHCQGRGEVTNRAVIANGLGYDCAKWASPCPVCKPPPSARETWMEVVRLGRREP